MFGVGVGVPCVVPKISVFASPLLRPDLEAVEQACERVTSSTLGRAILYTTTTQRGWCIEAFVSILAHLQSLKLLPGGGGV